MTEKQLEKKIQALEKRVAKIEHRLESDPKKTLGKERTHSRIAALTPETASREIARRFAHADLD